jgi:hypothetical protein
MMLPTLDARFKLSLMILTPNVDGNKWLDDEDVGIPVISWRL